MPRHVGLGTSSKGGVYVSLCFFVVAMVSVNLGGVPPGGFCDNDALRRDVDWTSTFD